MGTSTSSRGPGGDSPLVPPWADKDGQGPGPIPPPQRFKEFRKSLGKFVSGGNHSDLRAALGKYAGTATGGNTVGPRRFGSMAHAGGALFDALTGSQDGRETPSLDLTTLNGQDTDLAIDIIIRALLPNDGDDDRIRIAMNEALSECLDGYAEFDFSHITDEMLVQMMLAYVGRCVFGQVVLDSKDAFARAESSAQAETAEADLLALVEAATDKHMRPLLSGNVRMFNRTQIADAQLRAITEVWTEWEAYLHD
ncbi:hypothetical protein BCF11_1544 [Collimonas sp. PA-H2]|uniref:hypothetical protein n=1 Tax=Collimonas sp. PA-H2 TaxID=1881062 RepID=UPI000C01E45D|nr:hypothetical protein [Collimonas sp. PA-H2]PFH09154.1 hypothetical protein BCF11_1544 [Collimonas sp. PA-H2]